MLLNFMEISLEVNGQAMEYTNGTKIMNMKATLKKGSLMGKEILNSKENLMLEYGLMGQK